MGYISALSGAWISDDHDYSNCEGSLKNDDLNISCIKIEEKTETIEKIPRTVEEKVEHYFSVLKTRRDEAEHNSSTQPNHNHWAAERCAYETAIREFKLIFPEFREKNEIKQEAELCYSQAVAYKHNGKLDEAKRYAQKAIDLYKELNVQTLEDAAPTRMRVNGVELPDIMHQDVVKQRLGIE